MGARALAAAAASGILVGAAVVATRFALQQSDLVSIAFLRYAIAVCVLLPAAAASGGVRIARRDMPPVAMLGVAQFGILILLLNYALQYISAARGAVIFATMPLLTMLFAAVMGYERLGLQKSFAVLLSIVGVALATGEAAFTSSAGTQWLGEFAALASALCGAVCSVLYRPYLRAYPTLEVSAFAMAASVVFLAACVVVRGAPAHLVAFDPAGWFAVAFLALASGLGYFFWLFALAHASPTRVTVFLSLSPITAALLGTLLLHEAPTAGTVGGTLCVVGALALARRS